MQPWRHAQLTTRSAERSWQEDLPIHEFMDLAKHCCPDTRHRLVLHNCDLGPELASRAFADRVDARDVAIAHVRQDLGATPTVQSWLDRCDPARLPKGRCIDLDALLLRAARHQRLASPEPVRSVWELLTLPGRFAPRYGELAWCVLMNSFGPVLVRAIMGPARTLASLDGGEAVFDPAWTAEGLIVAYFGAIPELAAVLSAFRGAINDQ